LSNKALMGANMAELPRYANVADVPRHWAAIRPNYPALKWSAGTLTYGDLDRRSSKLANRLVRAGASASAPVGYLGANAAMVFEAWFAAAKAGAALAPFNWRSPAAELADVVADAQPSVVFVDRARLETAQAVKERISHRFAIVSFDPAEHAGDIDQWCDGEQQSDPGGPGEPMQTALLAYTSGTTGLAKGVAMPHAAFAGGFAAASASTSMTWRADDIVIMAMPNFHLGGSFLSMHALMTGATTVILPSFDIGTLLAAVRAERATILPLVPTALRMLLDDPRLEEADTKTLRKIIYFGSPIGSATVERALAAFDCELIQYYGTTECWILTMLDGASHDPARPNLLASCGTPAPGVTLRLLDSDGRDVLPGEIGEIAAKSSTMFSSYWRNAKATQAAFDSGWYKTGDLGRRDSEGYYSIVDRAKDMIVSGGENVYSAEVERALSCYPGVALAGVVGAPDAHWGERVVAFVTSAPTVNLDPNILKAHCRTLLAGYKVPKDIFIESALPLTANGKVHKPTLREKLRGAPAQYSKGRPS
jgi:acyl-CoA synthetase (AMP-forming)/AMP-acid ligase II